LESPGAVQIVRDIARRRDRLLDTIMASILRCGPSIKAAADFREFFLVVSEGADSKAAADAIFTAAMHAATN
jgi:hypothetical protein